MPRAGAPTASIPVVPGRPVVLQPANALVYHVFAGELALERNADVVAAREYAAASRLSTDPALAAHATLVAYGAGDNVLALALTARWLQLAPGDDAAEHLQAVLNTRLGHIQAAVDEFSRLLHTAPAQEFVTLEHMLEEETEPAQCLPVLQQLVARYPDLAEAHYALARLALRGKQPSLAEHEAGRAVELKPQWDAAVVLQANALLAEDNGRAALDLLRTHHAKSPGDRHLQLAYAAMLAELGESSAARGEFAAVLKAAPRDPDALYALGLLALQDKELGVANGYFQRLLATGQRSNEAFYFLGTTAENSKAYAKALDWYQQVDGGNYWFPAQIASARVMLAEGHVQAARDYIDLLVSADPDDGAKFRLAEAQLFNATGDPQDALAIFNRGLAEYAGDVELLYGRALLQESLGNVAAAESDLRTILVHDSDNADALNALGYILTLHSKRYPEARGYIEKALQLKPGDPVILDSLGWVEYRLGDNTRAVSELRRAYAGSGDPQIAAHLSEALWAAGERQAAKNVWSEALARHPGDATLVKLGSRFAQ
ncbi:MAG: tetratricopeptide repeat protein [Gammaproteobacteria bacterium]